MAREISAEELAAYRAGAERRQLRQAREAAARRERAWEVAREAARVLREEFGARRVVAFGSLARAAGFHARSDVDLAAWGIGEDVYYRAVSRLLGLDPDISVDLIRVEYAAARLVEAAEREGVDV
jgi:predicted nucleotidyltransferase